MRKFILLFLLAVVCTVTAQDVEPQRVEVTAEDGLVLVGDFYSASDAEAPTVLLLHMLEGSRKAWNPLIPRLIEAGYNVLAVDLRGHGETGGKRDWQAAQTDTQVWLGWLREQPNVADDQVSIIGASIGTILAINGCAADEQCMTAIALSPVNFTGLETDEAVSKGLSKRSLLLVSGQRDGNSPNVARHMLDIMKGDVAVRLYAVPTHGTDLLGARNPTTNESVMKLVITWLDEHRPKEK
jgi:dipeptidyl aminopeptidase/acylaminoacyl peptidase